MACISKEYPENISFILAVNGNSVRIECYNFLILILELYLSLSSMDAVSVYCNK